MNPGDAQGEVPRRPRRDEPRRLPHLRPATPAAQRRRRPQARPPGVRGHALRPRHAPARPPAASPSRRRPATACRRRPTSTSSSPCSTSPSTATTSPTRPSTSRRARCSTSWAGRANGRSYTRLRDVLRRLKSLTIRYENAWWDAAGRGYEEEVATGVISAYKIARQVSGPRTADTTPLSWATWTQQFHQSLLNGNIKRLDLDLFFRLKTPTAQRMYRFLDKRFYNSDSRVDGPDRVRLRPRRPDGVGQRRHPQAAAGAGHRGAGGDRLPGAAGAGGALSEGEGGRLASAVPARGRGAWGGISPPHTRCKDRMRRPRPRWAQRAGKPRPCRLRRWRRSITGYGTRPCRRSRGRATWNRPRRCCATTGRTPRR